MNKQIKFLGIITLLTLVFACGNKKRVGCIEGDCQNGYGTMRYTNGGTLTGNWVNGELNGYGEEIWGKGKFEGDIYKGNYENGIRKGEGSLYKADIDATFVGVFDDDESDYAYNGRYITGHFKVYFGKNSIYEGTFEGDLFYSTSDEWEKRTAIENTKNTKIIAPNANFFLAAIDVFYQYDSIQDYIIPLEEFYEKDFTKEEVSDEEIDEFKNSLSSIKKIVNLSLERLNLLQEFDKEIPLKNVLYEHLTNINKKADSDYELIKLLQQPPSKLKLLAIMQQSSPSEIALYNSMVKYEETYQKFIEKHAKWKKEDKNKNYY